MYRIFIVAAAALWGCGPAAESPVGKAHTSLTGELPGECPARRVLMCHGATTSDAPAELCVAVDAVDAHFAHGDWAGDCSGPHLPPPPPPATAPEAHWIAEVPPPPAPPGGDAEPPPAWVPGQPKAPVQPADEAAAGSSWAPQQPTQPVQLAAEAAEQSGWTPAPAPAPAALCSAEGEACGDGAACCDGLSCAGGSCAP